MEVQTTGTQRQEGASVATGRPNTEPRAVRALEVPHRRVLKPDGTSRMSREAHVRICGGRRVRFPPATRRVFKLGLEPTTFCMASGSWVRVVCGSSPHR